MVQPGQFLPPKKAIEKWRTVITKMGLKESSSICLRHFDEEDISKGRIIEGVYLNHYKRWRLREGAMPLHFLAKKTILCHR